MTRVSHTVVVILLGDDPFHRIVVKVSHTQLLRSDDDISAYRCEFGARLETMVFINYL